MKNIVLCCMETSDCRLWDIPVVFLSNQKVTTALKPQRNKLWKKKWYNIGLRFVCLDKQKNLPIIHSHTFVFPRFYHKSVFSHIRRNYYFHVTDSDLWIYSDFSISRAIISKMLFTSNPIGPFIDNTLY